MYKIEEKKEWDNMSIILREATKEDENEVLAMYKEYLEAEPINGIDTFEGIRDFEHFETMNYDEWLQDLEFNKIKSNLPDNYSSHTLYLAVNDEKKIVGAIGLRWDEVEVLMTYGGLIGYSIRPSQRGKGYASDMLKEGLDIFRKTGREKILITCKDFNIASKKVIEKNGGKLLSQIINPRDNYNYLRYEIVL